MFTENIIFKYILRLQIHSNELLILVKVHTHTHTNTNLIDDALYGAYDWIEVRLEKLNVNDGRKQKFFYSIQ